MMVEESFVRILTVVALFSVGTVSAITTATKESRIAAAPAAVHRYGTLAETKWHEVIISEGTGTKENPHSLEVVG